MIAELESPVGAEVELLAPRAALRRLRGANPARRRLAPPPRGLADLVPAERGMQVWDEAAAVHGTELSNDSDIDLRTVVRAPEPRDALEVRIFPGTDDAVAVVRGAALVEGLPLRRRCGGRLPPPSGFLTEDAAELRRRGTGRW